MEKRLYKTILIIEDNPGDQLLLHENLLSTNLLIADVTIVDTLTEGINYLSRKNFSLIFLDLFLPDSSGLESFKELIKIKPAIPVIIYSGLSDTKIALNAITLGAQDFLIKGDYTLSLLEKTVRYSIERKKNLDALQISNTRFSLISKATHDMIWDWDLITGEVYRNIEGWQKIFKSKNGEEDGTIEDWSSRVHPEDRKKIEHILKELISSDSEELFEVEFRIIREDKTIGFIKDRGYIIRDGKGKALRLMGASHDITERKNAEEKVLLSEQRFKSLVQNSSDLLAILDVEGNYTYVSPSCKRILGYDPEFFLGESGTICMHPDDVQKPTPSKTVIGAEKFVIVLPFRIKNALGEWRWIEGSMTNMLDDPAINGIVVNSRDVTEKKIADDEIEKLSLVAKHTLSGIFILDKDRIIQWVNDAFTKITGFTLEDAIGKKPPDLLYGKNPDARIFEEVEMKMAKGISFTGDRIYHTKSGKPIWVSLQLQPVYDGRGEIKQHFGVITDITEKILAETELKKLSMIAKETINGVVISDKDQNVVWVNDAFTKMCGYELDEVIGKNPLQFLQGPETNVEVIDWVKEQIEKKESFVFEILNYSKTGKKFIVRVQLQPMFDKDGNIYQFFALQTDITIQKALEEKVELEKIIKQKEITDAVYSAQESERSEIGRELHDNVNQLLGATRLYIDMAKKDEENKDSLLTSASDFTLNAIEEIRKLSKTLITPLIKEMGLADAIIDLTEEIMLVHPIKILVTASHFIEEGLDEKFKLNIFRIVQEQINNALKHAEAKEININIEDNYGKLLLSITDNGIGFDTTKRKNGVGITNIKSRSELYNGIVQLASEQGKGTSLSITFNKADLLLMEHNESEV
ncbi:MAG: hypothetical protein JWO92_2032 [Chitinophagaceae bacterium]|nr:hypothetical protein [Chitinophagaceae bacterium]